MLKVKVRVPATTANLGAGFNCLGMALGLYNTLNMQEARSRLKIKMTNHIPIARGLGSSAASIIAGAVAANELCEKKLSQADLIQLCAELEGHADNIVAAFLGGLAICGYCTSGRKDRQLIYKNFFVNYGIRAIVAIPQNLEVKTKDAVAVLPKKVPFVDAVFNISCVALFVSGIINDDLEAMGLGMEDRLHQPYRKALIPGLDDVFKAAKKAGAHGVSLSGAGSSVVAITNRYPQPIGIAMKKAFKRNGIEAKVMILDADNEGVKSQTKKA